MKTRAILMTMLAAMFSLSVSARTIKGTVTHAGNNNPIPGVSVTVKNKPAATTTDNKGKYTIQASSGDILVFSKANLQTRKIVVNNQKVIDVVMKPVLRRMDEVILHSNETTAGIRDRVQGKAHLVKTSHFSSPLNFQYHTQGQYNREGYSTIHENDFREVRKNPLSTFSIDVDAASYSNIRRFLNNGRKPPVDAVRIEEMINYFTYDYAEPKNGHPFSINRELGRCPWNNDNLLLHIGLQGKKIDTKNLPPSNIVFLIDVSGSMRSPNKLPLLKKAFRLLVNQLRPEDRVAMVVYAGSSGLVLSSTPGDEKEQILCSLEKLQAGGSTAGGAGLKLAYQMAYEHFIEDGNNRVILATDGDFNVGPSSDAEMERLIIEQREKGIFISVLGFGTGNIQDSKMETIADKGNGNYAYIDNLLEAKKVLVNEFGGTLFTIAKDVKIQIEFNPAVVESYRLIGYENRLLNEEDFDNDKKDAGELGSGHSVTALYEIKPAQNGSSGENALKYQTTRVNQLAEEGNEIATIKFRYKKPDDHKSILLEEVIPYADRLPREMSDNFKFSSAVAGFGMLLRDSDYKGDVTYNSVINLAQEGKGKDEEGYRSEFIRLMKLAKHL